MGAGTGARGRARRLNRAGTGMCPLEQCVQGEEDPAAAWTKIENKIAELMKAEHPFLPLTIQ